MVQKRNSIQARSVVMHFNQSNVFFGLLGTCGTPLKLLAIQQLNTERTRQKTSSPCGQESLSKLLPKKSTWSTPSPISFPILSAVLNRRFPQHGSKVVGQRVMDNHAFLDSPSSSVQSKREVCQSNRSVCCGTDRASLPYIHKAVGLPVKFNHSFPRAIC